MLKKYLLLILLVLVVPISVFGVAHDSTWDEDCEAADNNNSNSPQDWMCYFDLEQIYLDNISTKSNVTALQSDVSTLQLVVHNANNNYTAIEERILFLEKETIYEPAYSSNTILRDVLDIKTRSITDSIYFPKSFNFALLNGTLTEFGGSLMTDTFLSIAEEGTNQIIVELLINEKYIDKCTIEEGEALCSFEPNISVTESDFIEMRASNYNPIKNDFREEYFGTWAILQPS